MTTAKNPESSGVLYKRGSNAIINAAEEQDRKPNVGDAFVHQHVILDRRTRACNHLVRRSVFLH